MAAKPSDKKPDQPASKLVRLVNRLSQPLTVTVDAGTGTDRQIVLAGNAASDPVLESSLTKYTRSLVEQGRVATRSV